MKKLLFICAISLSLAGCKKDSGEDCYTAKDAAGSTIGHVCGDNEDDAYNKAKGSTYGGITITTRAEFNTYFKHD